MELQLLLVRQSESAGDFIELVTPRLGIGGKYASDRPFCTTCVLWVATPMCKSSLRFKFSTLGRKSKQNALMRSLVVRYGTEPPNAFLTRAKDTFDSKDVANYVRLRQ
jgi:hypothetical protein